MGLAVLQAGGLDLSSVLGAVKADDLFARVEEEVTMHAGDDDFDIQLDAPDQPEGKRTPIVAPRAGVRATEEALAGLAHLTIEFDVAAAMQGHDAEKASGGLEQLTLASGALALPEPSAPPPAVPGASAPPAHMTIEIEPESMAMELSPELPPDTLAGSVSGPPPYAQETPATQDISLSLSLDISSLDLASITSATDPAERLERTQSVDAEPPESVDTTMSTHELRGADAAGAPVEAETGMESSEVGGAVSATLDSFVLSVDDALFASQVGASAGSDIAAIIDPSRSAVDEPPLEEGTLLLASESAPDMSVSAAEPPVPDLTPPTLDDPALTLMDEDVPPIPPSLELPAMVGDATPKSGSTSAGMLALEDLAAPALSEHITLELDASELEADLQSNFFEDAAHTPSHGDTETTRVTIGTGPEQSFTPSDAVALGALDDTTLPGHLTLELDASEITASRSSSTLDDMWLDAPRDVQSKASTPQNEADDGEGLRLDLDAFEIDDTLA
jgi:hypothetical protein